MKILIKGVDRSNFNYKKIEGFFNAFSKMGETEWVTNMFDCRSDDYDIVFGEINLSELEKNADRFLKMNIKKLIFWRTYSIKKLIKVSNYKKDTLVINAYKTNILNRDIVSRAVKYGISDYQVCEDEGVNLNDVLSWNLEKLPCNLRLCYLPCCLSERTNYVENRPYDVCYFGSIGNRPGVKKALDILSKKYKIITNEYDKVGIMSPEKCFNFYKESKVTLSEQIDPVIMEYPVRLGESTSTGCRLFLIEPIDIRDKSNPLIPDYTPCNNVEDMVSNVEMYLSEYSTSKSKEGYDNFNSTYDNAVSYLTEYVCRG